MACKEYCWWVLTLDGNVYAKEKSVFINIKQYTNLIELSVSDLHIIILFDFCELFSVYFMLKLKKYILTNVRVIY